MIAQHPHALLSRPTVDELGREGFLAAMRRFLVSDLYAGNEVAYRRRQLPAFKKRMAREPQSHREVRDLMETDAYYRAFSLLNRATQELLWDTVGESVERQLPALVEAAAAVAPAGGSLTLDPSFALPDYATKVDIHVMPGSFHTELGPDDVYAGAVYDRGVYIYAYGGLGDRNEGLGEGAIACVKQRFPDLKPRRILDMGCGAGMSTLPLAAAFPGAEIYAVDIAAPMLRYGHARAEAMGVAVHYSQQNAGDTNFEDGSFDLVLSNLLLHEIPQKLTKQIIRECYRLLGQGGVHVHNDMVGWPTDPFQEFMAEWNGHHNNEPFERGSGTLDWTAACLEAGFLADDIFLQPIGAAYMAEQLAFVGYRGAQRR
jgi:2-polyprenyl-3-methyl-5-hydroxy-6-metoxy-1,4-benzoquinol methylase